MQTKKSVPHYWFFENHIDDQTIEKIMSIADNNQWDMGSVSAGNAFEVNPEVRETDIIWNNEQWLYDIFWHLMNTANKNSGWNLEITAAESFQLGRYGKGGHYDYHLDGIMMDPYHNPENPLVDGKTRKLSMVCWLNEEFTGGEFEFHESGCGQVIKPTKGTVVFFPSFLAHRVRPVIEGTRYSLVTWFLGPPIK